MSRSCGEMLEGGATRAETAIMAWRRQVQAEREELHSVAVMFTEKAVAVALAWITSQTNYEILCTALSAEDRESPDKARPYKLMARGIHAAIASIVSPLLSWLLRGRADKGETLFKDSLRLLTKCLPMLLAWAWKDFVSQLCTIADGRLWGYLVIALTLTLIISILQMLPCIARADEVTKAGSAEGTCWARVLSLPCHLDLALGYAWNEVADLGVTRLQDKVTHMMAKALIQFAYFLVIHVIIVRIIGMWTRKREKVVDASSRHVGQEGGDTEAQEAGEIAAEKARQQSGKAAVRFQDLLTISLGYVHAWGLSNTLNDWWFMGVETCTSSTACNLNSNIYFSGLISFFFAWLIARIPPSIGQIRAALNMQAMSLSVGWAWTNATTVLTNELCSSERMEQAVAYIIMSLVLDPIFFLLYHGISQQLRFMAARSQRQDQEIMDCIMINVQPHSAW